MCQRRQRKKSVPSLITFFEDYEDIADIILKQLCLKDKACMCILSKQTVYNTVLHDDCRKPLIFQEKLRLYTESRLMSMECKLIRGTTGDEILKPNEKLDFLCKLNKTLETRYFLQSFLIGLQKFVYNKTDLAAKKIGWKIHVMTPLQQRKTLLSKKV